MIREEQFKKGSRDGNRGKMPHQTVDWLQEAEFHLRARRAAKKTDPTLPVAALKTRHPLIC
jgi:hypothetical protein